MRTAPILAFLLLGALLCACAEDDTYPLSGEPCGEEDAVLDMEAADCGAGLGAGTGTF